jgi:hypothetical protein
MEKKAPFLTVPAVAPFHYFWVARYQAEIAEITIRPLLLKDFGAMPQHAP